MLDPLPLLSLLPAVASTWLYLKARRELHALREAHARDTRDRDGRMGLIARSLADLKVRTARMESAASRPSEREYHRVTLDGIVRLQDTMRGN